jgi:hypothetical protein
VLAVGIDMWRDEIGRLRFFSRTNRPATSPMKEGDDQ